MEPVLQVIKQQDLPGITGTVMLISFGFELLNSHQVKNVLEFGNCVALL